METMCSEEAIKYIWEGAIPLQIQLHESEITSIPPPPPLMILGLRIGYLPLLIAPLKAHFSSALPPGTDNVWFDYKGLPIKWYVPTGVLFDLLCAEPERPWNLTVHFRGSPGDVLTPCEGEESVKWSYINSLKEAAYVINGNCKNVMNMSQADQYDLWQSLLKGNMEGYMKISSRLKLRPFGEDSLPSDESETVASSRPCRIPVRLYIRSVGKEIAEVEDAPIVDSWDKISYINRPFEMYKEEGGYVSLKQAMKSLLPEIFDTNSSQDEGSSNDPEDPNAPNFEDESMKLILVRVQGIELDMDIPFFWVANCLKNPEFYLHICLVISKQPKLR
ncbi:autophagy protein Apg5 family [Carex rostrata]